MTRRGVLAGEIAVVVGAGGALGRAAACVLAEAGASVALAGRGRDDLEATAGQVRSHGGRVLVVPTDVTSPERVEALVDRVLEEYGAIDVLVNFAGRLDPMGVPLWDADPEEWLRTMATNVTGVFLSCRAVVPQMLLQGRGRIINPSSGSARVPIARLGTYCVSKAALGNLTDVLALELEGSGVSVTDVWMGATRSPMTTEVRELVGRQHLPTARDPLDALAMLPVVVLADAERVNGRTVWREEPWVRAGVARLALAGTAS